MFAVLALIQAEEDERNEKRRTEMAWKRHLRDTSDPFMMGDEIFHQRYRMYPWVSIQLIEMLRPHLNDDERGVQPHLQVLAVLRFLAEGSYQKGVALDAYHPMSTTTFSRYLHQVIPAIIVFGPQFVRFPATTEERQVVQQGFEERLHFLGVIGAVDCTLPKIHAPADHEEAYVNYKNEHSFCVQAACDTNYNLLNVRVCSGSTNDRFAWRYSDIRQEMLRLRQDDHIVETEGRYYFIADNGYTPSSILLIPINDAPRGTPEFNFSDTIRRSRCRIEQVFGIWKQSIRCINGERSLYYEPGFGAEIILASGVLYNFLRHHGMQIPDLGEERLQNNYFVEDQHEFQLGLQERQAIIENFFAN